MIKKFKVHLLLGSLALGAVFVPATIDWNTLSADPLSGSAGIVRLNQACGQATECVKSYNYICSTTNKDWEGYKCSQGCDN